MKTLQLDRCDAAERDVGEGAPAVLDHRPRREWTERLSESQRFERLD